MDIDTITYRAEKDGYHSDLHLKKKICLHFTAGFNARGAFSAFQQHKNGTAFIVDRDGKAYQYFDPKYWACHLYRHEHGEDKMLYDLEKDSIGIEIVNVAWLAPSKKVKDNKLYTYTGKVFCDLDETDKYVKADYRGHFYWQSFTEQQYMAVREIVYAISQQANINIFNTPPGGRLSLWKLNDMWGYEGITTHANYRPDKFDIGPAWDWTKLNLR
jgi:N-acetyl-anhydromuramyl-L-alanine amidase AmpD